MDVSGVAIVIGAGSGTGRESALLFAERGAQAVVFADQDVAAAKAASEESKGIATAKSYETLALHVDVRDRQSVKAAITAAKEKLSRLDYAINCAGIPRMVAAELSTLDEMEYDNLHDVNAKGILHCLQEEISVMKDQLPLFAEGRSGQRSVGPGAIVNTVGGQKFQATYQNGKLTKTTPTINIYFFLAN